MNGVVTEKNYPVENIWIFKGIYWAIPIFLLLLLYYFTRDGGEVSDRKIGPTILMYLVIIPGILIFTILRKITFHYTIDDKFLTLKQGILNKQQRHIPYGVIQHAFIKQDLFDRLFGLASLTLENASMGAGSQPENETRVFGLRVPLRKRKQMEMVGFSGNKVSIPGLKKENAEILKNIVLQKMKENPIDDNQSGL